MGGVALVNHSSRLTQRISKAISFLLILLSILFFSYNSFADEDDHSGKQRPPGPPPGSRGKPTEPTSPLIGTQEVVKVSAQLSAGTGATVSTLGNSGAAGASIPIEVPPGRNGIAPNLTLSYNSSKGNGWIGVGWDISLGAISRSTKRGVAYNSNDYVFSLGLSTTELIARNDWGGNYYGAKIEGPFTKYYFSHSSGGWEVTTKDGTKYYYGTTAASRQDNAYGTFKWCLDKVQDLNGNYMTVTYLKDNGDIYLYRIDYTGNTHGLSATNYVQFYYEGRSDIVPMYTTNSPVQTIYRLKTIDVVANGNRARTYRLNYTQGPVIGRTLLQSIQQFGDNANIDASGNVLSGSSLPLTSFEWSQPQSIQSSDNPNTGQGANAIAWLTGDFDGDGKTDLVQIFDDGSRGALLYKSNGTGYASPTYSHLINVTGGASGETWLTGDVDGDGKTDLIYAYWDAFGGYQYLKVFLSNGTNFTYTNPGSNYERQGQVALTHWLTADVDGDGKIDLVSVGSSLQVSKPSPSGQYYSPTWSGGSNYYTTDDTWLTGDFDGNGKTDILAIYEDPSGVFWYTVFLSDGNGYSYPPNCDNSWVWSTGTNALITADVNGDGKSDLVRANSGIVTAYLWGGSCFLFGSPWNSSVSSYWGQWTAGDISGDGMIDLFQWNPYGGNQVSEYVSNGTTYSTAAVISNIAPDFSSGGGNLLPADVNGEGKTGLVRPYVKTDGTLGISAYRTDGEPADLLTKITRGNAYTTIAYAPSSQYSNTLMPFVVQTVSSITVYDGNGITSPTYYSYSGGLFDYASREFRGFSVVTQTNPDGTYIESGYLQDDIYKGLLWAQVVYNSTGFIYTAAVNTYQAASYSGASFPYLNKTDNYLCDGIATLNDLAAQAQNQATSPCKWSQTAFVYDSYGNITQRFSYGDMGFSGDEKYEYIDYAYDTNNWIVSTPSSTYTYDYTWTLKSRTWFDYWPGTSNLKTKTFGWNVSNKLDANNPKIGYEYDQYGYGNLWKVTDARSCTTTTTYDTSTYTYPNTITNCLGHQAIKTYDYRFGKVASETDPNLNVTSYLFDPFGRVNNSSNQNNGTNAFKWKETYYDGLGRTTKVRTAGPDNKVIVQETKYNSMGRVYQTSLPYFENIESPRWSTNYYDAVGRVTQTTNPDGTYLTASYLLGQTTMIDADGHQRVETRDVYGRLVNVQEYTGCEYARCGVPNQPFALYATTTYVYDALGNLTDVWDARSNHTQIHYDSLSRKDWMSDPDMGYWQYGYDANGNLTSQSDAKSQNIQFHYDEINRIQWKQYMSCASCTDVHHTYDEIWSTNSKGRLTTVTDASGMQKFYYDKLGRVTTTIKTVDSINYTIETSYDSLGRTESITYPDGEIVYYTYDDGGNLTNVSNIINFSGYSAFNALGQPTYTAYGNGVLTTYQYYPSNNRLYSITTSSSAGLQNIAYGYDNAGNVTGITDYLDGSRTQTFVYDELNRIKTATSTGYGTISYQYDQIGNITSNSRVGTYAYWKDYFGTKPHAVYIAGSNTYQYDPNGNMYSGGGRSITYDFDNRPVSMTKNGTITLVYDYAGRRVKKNSTVYIGKLYECTGGVCTKHIFAGSSRVASKTGTTISYYHTDHLGSSS
ncbi:MAG: FG-GAP-like repeat-containing protein, partial [Nitrospiraceae bacterium]|nr:FG-GAP-like repeat-containing protein [Nitrospiraceae bacterium]